MKQHIQQQLSTLHHASIMLANTSAHIRNNALAQLAIELDTHRLHIKNANAKDMQLAQEQGLAESMRNRLMLDDRGIDSMIQAVKEIASQQEVLSEIISGGVRPSGINIMQIRIPLGVVLSIYESRPNVTIDTAALCIKSGNVILLKGGKEARYSNEALLACITRALESSGLLAACVQALPPITQEELIYVLQQHSYIDVVIPRGGSGLIDFIRTHSKIPAIFHEKGVCHAYIDKSANKHHAINICLNAKISRPSACNAIETILIHKDFPYCNELVEQLLAHHVEIRAEERAQKALAHIKHKALIKAVESDFGAEFGTNIVALKLVDSLEEAIQHIAQYGSQHSDIIITEHLESAQIFCKQVSSSAVFINASSRFNDGGELGLGAEMGISTQKLHVRGPMGAIHLTTTKYIIHGNGNIRV